MVLHFAQEVRAMKRIIIALLLTVLFTSGLLLGCGGVLTGSGNVETRQFDYSDFTQVDVGSAFTFEIVQSNSYGVSVTADDNLFEYIQVSKVGETLKIGLKTITSLGPVTLRAAVSMPQLHGLDASGATHGTISNFRSTEKAEFDISGASRVEFSSISAGNVELNISGASGVTGDLIAGNVDLDLSGASSVQLEGSANDIEVDAGGASRVRLGDFSSNNVDISLSGASSATVNPSGRLDADLSGGSKLTYIGEPTMGTINTSGGSSLSRQ